MLSQQLRLKKKKDFDRNFKIGKSVSSPLFYIKFSRNNLTVNRFGFVVSKSVSKKAVVRNKLKRRLREAVKIYILKGGSQNGSSQKNVDIIIVARPGAEKSSFQDVKTTLARLLEKAAISRH